MRTVARTLACIVLPAFAVAACRRSETKAPTGALESPEPPLKDILYLGASLTNEVLVLDATDAMIRSRIKFGAPHGSLTGLAFSPDGRRAYVHTNVSHVGIIDAGTTRFIGELEVTRPGEDVFRDLRLLRIFPDGDVLYVCLLKITEFDDRGRVKKTVPELRTIDLKTRKVVGTTPWPENAEIICVAPGDGRLVVLREGKTFATIDASTGRLVKEHLVPVPPGWAAAGVVGAGAFAISPRGKIFAILTGRQGQDERRGVVVFDPIAATVESFAIDGDVPFFKHYLAVSPDEKFLFASFNSIARISLDRRCVEKLRALDSTAHQVLVSRDGTRLFLPRHESCRILHATTLEEIGAVRYGVSVFVASPMPHRRLDEDERW